MLASPRILGLFAALTISALAFSFAPVLAQQQPDPAPTMVPYAKPDLAPLMYFSGTWTCKSMLRGSMRPDTSTASMDPGGMWLHTHDVAPPFDKYRTKAITTDSYMTYNSTSKEFVVINMDDFGNYSTSTSPGWNGNTFVWTDKMSNDGGLGVTTLNKKSATEYSFNNVGKDASGKPVPPTNGTCTKSS